MQRLMICHTLRMNSIPFYICIPLPLPEWQNWRDYDLSHSVYIPSHFPICHLPLPQWQNVRAYILSNYIYICFLYLPIYVFP